MTIAVVGPPPMSGRLRRKRRHLHDLRGRSRSQTPQVLFPSNAIIYDNQPLQTGTEGLYIPFVMHTASTTTTHKDFGRMYCTTRRMQD